MLLGVLNQRKLLGRSMHSGIYPAWMVVPMSVLLATEVVAFPQIVGVSSLATSEGLSFDGAQDGAEVGASVTQIGDFNGDGVDDIAIAAKEYNASQFDVDAGAVDVIFGASGGSIAQDLTALDGTTGFRFTGANGNDYVGASVSGGGDINGDGLDDLIIGAPGYSEDATLAGASYVIFGTNSPSATITPSSIDAGVDLGIIVKGAAAGNYAGGAVALAGDIDGDGFDDFVVGAPTAAVNGSASGIAYVIFGQSSLPGSFVLGDTVGDGKAYRGFAIQGESENDQAGSAVSSAGDINNDGLDDLIVGAPLADSNGEDAGASYVIFGQSNLAGDIALDGLTSGQGFKIVGESLGDESGQSVASAGDINRDGFDDMLVGAPGVERDGKKAGAGYVIFGQTSFSAPLSLANLDGANGFKIEGKNNIDPTFGLQGSELGTSVSSAGDVNDDGFDDIVLGAPFDIPPNYAQTGAAYVVFGGQDFPSQFSVGELNGDTGFMIAGEFRGDWLGQSVSSAGDVNDDGINDLIVGAPFADPNLSVTGAGHVIFGQSGGFARLHVAQQMLTLEDTALSVVSSTEPVTVTNTGTAPLQIDALSVTGSDASDFQLTEDSCSNQTLAVDAQCGFSVTLTPSALGARSASVTIPSNALTSPDSIGLNGAGVLVGEVAVSGGALDFGSVRVDEASTQSRSLTNVGDGPLVIDALVIEGAHASDFVLSNDSCSNQTLAADAQCGFSVTLTPSADGERSASLSIPSNALSNPEVIALTGTGYRLGSLAVSAASLDLGSVLPNQKATQVVVVTNTGPGDLVLSQAVLAGADQFKIAADECSGQTLSAGDSCEVRIEVTGAGAGSLQATLSIPSDNGTQVVSLKAQALAPVPVVAVQPGWLALLAGLLGWLGIRRRQ